jgi:hypothetical protein
LQPKNTTFSQFMKYADPLSKLGLNDLKRTTLDVLVHTTGLYITSQKISSQPVGLTPQSVIVETVAVTHLGKNTIFWKQEKAHRFKTQL